MPIAATDIEAGAPAQDKAARRPSLLVLDMSYTLEMIRERGLENSVTCRDLDGFFGHVWSVHPMASLMTSPGWAKRFGKPDWHELGPRHTFIEGKIGAFSWLSRVFPINFLISQTALFFTLWRLIRREGIEVIRVGDPLYLGLFGLALSRLTGVPMLIRVNGNNDKIRENTGRPLYPKLFRTIAMEKRIEHFILPRADLVAAPNQDNVDYSLANGAHPDRVTIFRYGNLLAPEHLEAPEARICDTAFFEGLGLRPGKYLLCIGRLQPLKYPEDVLKAFALVRAEMGDIDLAYAGDGPMRDELEAMAQALGVAEHVRFIGNQNQRGLAQLNAFSGAVISPLTGRALSESALGGAPIVAYDLDWQADLVQTGETGELVPFREPEELGRRALKLLRDRDYAKAMGRAARARALAILDPQALDDHERAEYTKLLTRTAKRG